MEEGGDAAESRRRESVERGQGLGRTVKAPLARQGPPLVGDGDDSRPGWGAQARPADGCPRSRNPLRARSRRPQHPYQDRRRTPAHLIDGAEDIQLDWLAGVSTIGLTAGASAPPAVVEEIIAALSGLGPVSVSERVTTTESIRFGLPKEVRQ